MRRSYNSLRNDCVSACLLAVLILTACCSREDLVIDPGPVTCLRFTVDDDYLPGAPEYIRASCIAQTYELRVLSTTYETVPMPKDLDYLYIREWDENREVFDTPYWEKVNEPDDFYHVSIEKDSNGPLVKIQLKENTSNEERKVLICIGDFSDRKNKVVGSVVIMQDPDYSNGEPFTLRAKYKDKMYESMVKLDSVGNFIYLNEEYEHLMHDIDSNPSAQLVIMSDSVLHYYDDDDITSKRIYTDIQQLPKEIYKHKNLNTRATGFENIKDGNLGFMAVYEHDNFRGITLSKGLDNFHFTHTLPSLRPYDLNDRITSIAVAYNGSDPNVCSVLTIWDDADFNNGDDNRKKHRISIIATKNNTRVTCPNLKKLKKIGSSKSWNDCISSLSFHFGYNDSLLLDY